MQATDDCGDADPTCGVRLWVKKQLGVHHVIASGFHEVGVCHVVKILLGDEHAGPCVIDVQKALQVGEGIGAAQGGHIGIGQLNVVALGQRKDQLGLE